MSRPPSRIRGNMAPPPRRTTALRATSITPALTGRSSPSGSVSSIAGVKRKERDFDPDSSTASALEGHDSTTNINVFVRCRGRNEREIRENSGVVVNTDGVKGTTVELSMGSSTLSNKTYHFDRVFSPAADQIMIFDEVLKPILDDVRNCNSSRDTFNR
jgi:kinesin family member 11